MSAVALGPDARHLVTTESASGWTVRAWDLDAGLQLWQEHLEDSVGAAAVSGDGRVLAISASGQISLFDLATGGRRGSTSRTLGNVGALAWAPSGRYVAAGNSEGRVALVAARGLTYEWLTTSGKKGITVLCVDPEGLFIAAGDVAGGVRVWKARTGERLWELERACAEAVVALAFGPDTLRATGADGGRRQWDIRSGEPHGAVVALPALRQVVAGPRGDLVAVLDERGGVTIRDDVTGRPVANLVEGSDICGLAAGAVLAGAGRHQVVRLWPWPERRDR